MKCNEAGPLLSQLIDGELKDAKRIAALDEHVAACPSCRAERLQLTALRRLTASLDRQEPRPGFEARLMERLAAEPVDGNLFSDFITAAKVLLVAGACTVVCLFAIAHLQSRATLSKQVESAAYERLNALETSIFQETGQFSLLSSSDRDA